MASISSYSMAPSMIAILMLLQPLALAQQGCGGSCQTLNDCAGQLICISGKCNDDPNIGSHTCSQGSSSQAGTCAATSDNPDSCCSSNTCYKTACSPAITNPTPAIMTQNDFTEGGKSECDDSYHANSEQVVALSTGWYNDGSRCNKQIQINGNGRSTMATVVDECDSLNGCDPEHNDGPPCANNIVDASDAVWQALGVSSNNDPLHGWMSITWQDV